MVFAKGISAQSWRITFILLCLIPSSLRAMFLEWWNRSKSLSSIWQHFSCLLDEGIPKIWKIEFSQWFLSYLQNRTTNSAHGRTFSPCLSLLLKSHRENSISSIFLESPYQIDMKIFVKCWKDFLFYFTTLETNRVCLTLLFQCSFSAVIKVLIILTEMPSCTKWAKKSHYLTCMHQGVLKPPNACRKCLVTLLSVNTI